MKRELASTATLSEPAGAEHAHARFLATAYFPSLDGLRCLALLPVIWHHATPHPLPGIAGKGAVGVDLFFALSGFLITTLLVRERREHGAIRLGAFYTRRALRIFPLYYLVLAGYTLHALYQPAGSPLREHLLHGLPFHATYTANWFVDYAVPHAVPFAFSWSLCVEEQFYLAWPLALAFLKKRRVAAGLVLAAIAFDTLAEQGAFAWLAPASGLRARMLTSFAVPIGCGALLALVLDAPRGFALTYRTLRSRWTAPFLLGLSGLLLLKAVTPYLALSVCLSLLVGALALPRDQRRGAWLQQPLLRRAGRLTYAGYLLHITAIAVVRRAAPTYAEHTAFVFFASLLLTLLLAEAAYRVLEQPLLRLRARYRTLAPERTTVTHAER